MASESISNSSIRCSDSTPQSHLQTFNLIKAVIGLCPDELEIKGRCIRTIGYMDAQAHKERDQVCNKDSRYTSNLMTGRIRYLEYLLENTDDTNRELDFFFSKGKGNQLEEAEQCWIGHSFD